MTILCFELSMPNRASWNGRWSGENELHAKLYHLGNSKAEKVRATKITEGGSYYYNFGDGWGASVCVRKVTAAEAKSINRRSKGFCGYDWMVQSILCHGDIRLDRRKA